MLAMMVLCCVMVGTHILAQGTIPGDPDNGVPLDGGLSIAIVAGIGYGVKRLTKKNKPTDDK